MSSLTLPSSSPIADKLYHAVMYGDAGIVTSLLEGGLDPNTRTNSYGALVSMCVRMGSLDVMKDLISRGADVDGHCARGLPALVHAVTAGDLKMCKLLLASGANVNGSIPEGCMPGPSPILIAAMKGDDKLMIVLLDAGAGVNSLSGSGMAPLTGAVSHVQKDCVRVLLAFGADPNLVDTARGWTAAMYAIQEGEAGVMGALCEHGFNIDVRGADGSTIMDMVASAGGNPAAEAFRKWRANLEKSTLAKGIVNEFAAGVAKSPRI